MRKEFTLSDNDLQQLYDAAKPVPYLVFGGVEPMSPTEKSNAVWAQLGDQYGFKWQTVEPTGGGDRFFTAEENALE